MTGEAVAFDLFVTWVASIQVAVFTVAEVAILGWQAGHGKTVDVPVARLAAGVVLIAIALTSWPVVR